MTYIHLIKKLNLINYLKRMNSSPTLFTMRGSSYQSILFNKLNLIFWSFIISKSKRLKCWCLEKRPKDVSILATKENFHQSLLANGVVIIPNFLSSEEHKELLNITRMPAQVVPKTYGESLMAYYSPLPDHTVHYFRSFIKKVFFSLYGIKLGNLTATIQHLILPPNSEDKNDPNTFLHIDRFVPAIKIFYFPSDVTSSDSPFGYVPGSHLINSHYLSAVKKAYSTFSPMRNRPFEIVNPSSSGELSVVAPANSLVIAGVHGIHRRQPFRGLEKYERCRISIRFIFYEKITKSRLIGSLFKV